MDRKQVMSVLSEGMQISGVGQASAAALYGYMDTRLHIIELQDKLAATQEMRDKLDLQAIKDGPVLTGDGGEAPNHLGCVVYNLLLESGPLKFADIMKALGKRHPMLKGVKYPSARVQAAIKRETAIERVAVGVYAAVKDSVKR